MRILIVSDLHGEFECVERARTEHRPDLILSCGDWGDPDQVSERAFEGLLRLVPVYTTFGNHDPLELLTRLKNQDESPVLIGQGFVQAFAGLRVAAIGGIWAKSHTKPHYVTDDDVAQAAERIARTGSVDILLTHGCPIGLADLTPTGRHGGQRCFLDAFKAVKPRLHLCGHLHRGQERVLQDGRKVMNVGATPEGSIVVVEFDEARNTLESKLEQLLPP
jgi:uncharacterized protein